MFITFAEASDAPESPAIIIDRNHIVAIRNYYRQRKNGSMAPVCDIHLSTGTIFCVEESINSVIERIRAREKPQNI